MAEVEKCPSCGNKMDVWDPGRCSNLEGFRRAGRCLFCHALFLDEREDDDPSEEACWVVSTKHGIHWSDVP